MKTFIEFCVLPTFSKDDDDDDNNNDDSSRYTSSGIRIPIITKIGRFSMELFKK